MLEAEETTGLKMKSRDPRLLEVGAHAFEVDQAGL